MEKSTDYDEIYGGTIRANADLVICKVGAPCATATCVGTRPCETNHMFVFADGKHCC